MSKGTLYLIPCTLGESPLDTVITPYIHELINTIDEYIVEEEKTARRYLKRIGIKKPLQEIILHPLNEHTDVSEISTYLNSIEAGKNIGIISEAGCPGVADPGAEAVKIAHSKNIKVVPLTGPSSILLSLMASGFNGQNFCFNGYLPKERNDRLKKLKELERKVFQQKQTQLFIETPYRNQHLLDDILQSCENSLLLCIACDITLETEFIQTKSVSEWKKNIPSINKRPAIFLLGS